MRLKNPFTYIGTKNRKNSHPKRKIFQRFFKNFSKKLTKKLRVAKKQLSRSGYSVIFSVIIGMWTIFPPPPAAPAGRKRCTAPRRLIEIRLEAAVLDAGLFREQIGENVQHQLLRLVNVVQIAVDIQGQGVAVFFHQGIKPFVVAAQILAVQSLVASHSVHFLFADASNIAGCLSGACPAGIAVLPRKARGGRLFCVFQDCP